jgi:integrase
MHKEAREGAVWLFEGRDHRKPFGGFSRFWNSVRKKAALPDFRVHDCRHNFASMLVQQGYSLPQIGKLLGHADPSTTNRYAHHNIEELRKLSDAAGQRFVVITGGKGEQALQEAVALSA